MTPSNAVGLVPDTEQLLGTAITAAGSANGSPTLVPAGRYVSNEFAELERRRLWPRVWQVACSLDHVAEPGDYFEYRVGGYSVVIVHGDDGQLRAFQNACRHRGNSLCTGTGGGLSEIRCPYHRWAWDLQGRLREVPSRRGFGLLRNEDFPLIPARVGTWSRLVFVNLDPGSPSLDDYLEGVPGDTEWLGLDEFRCLYSVVIPIKANLKVIADGFSETYHVQGIHREMLGSMDDINSGQQIWGLQAKSSQPYGVPSPRLGRGISDQVVWDSFIVTQGARMGVPEPCPVPSVPAGSSVADVIAERVRRHQAERGVDYSRFDTDQVLRLHQYNLFPNATVLVSADLFTVLFAKPGVSADDGELCMLHFERAASAAAARSRPFDQFVPAEAAKLGHVLNQDLGVLATVQQGLRQPGLTHLALSSEECRIINMHRNLERFLGIDPSELTGGPASAGGMEGSG